MIDSSTQQSDAPNCRLKFTKFKLTVAATVTGFAIVAALLHFSPDVFTKAPDVPNIDLSNVHSSTRTGIEGARELVLLKRDSALAWGHLGMTLWAHEYSPEAEICFEQAMALDKDDFLWPYFKGCILLATNRAAALAAFDEAVKRAPRHPQLNLRLGRALLESGQFDRAATHLKSTLQLSSENAEAHYLMANLLLQKQDSELAIVHAQKAVELAPDHSDCIGLLARLLRSNGQFSNSRFLSDKLRTLSQTKHGWPDPLTAQIDEFRRDPYWSTRQASQLAIAGNVSQGIRMLRDLVHQAPDEPSSRAQLIRLLLQQGALDEAQKYLDDESAGSSFELDVLRATLLLLRGNWSAAEHEYVRLLATKPDSPTLLSDRAVCLRELGRLDEAIVSAEAAVQLAPDEDRFRIELCRTLIKSALKSEALQNLQTILLRNPDHDEAKALHKKISGSLDSQRN